jgi:hypothetical protein
MGVPGITMNVYGLKEVICQKEQCLFDEIIKQILFKVRTFFAITFLKVIAKCKLADNGDNLTL